MKCTVSFINLLSYIEDKGFIDICIYNGKLAYKVAIRYFIRCPTLVTQILKNNISKLEKCMITNDDKIQSSLVYSVNRNEKHQSIYIVI